MAEDVHKRIERLYGSMYSKLLRYASGYLQDAHLAQDMVQDTFHEALNQAAYFSSHPNPEAWLMQTLKYKLQNTAKARARENARFLSFDDLPPGSTPGQAPELRRKPRSEETILAAAKEALRPEDYRLLVRLVIDRVSYGIAAGEQGISLWSAYKRMERIRKKLAQVLLDEDETTQGE